MPPKRRHKYNAEPTAVGGIRFDSKAEARRYEALRRQFDAGEIHDLRLQPSFQLIVGHKRPSGKKIPSMFFVADFWYTRGEESVVEDVKGRQTAKSKLQHALFQDRYPQHILKVVAAK